MEIRMFNASRSRSLLTISLICLHICLFAASQYGPVRPGESLEAIARKFSQTSNNSTEQWTVALWEANHEHFEAQNIFGLHSDIILTVPDQVEVEKVTQNMAIATIKEHSEAWQSLFNFEEIEELASSAMAYSSANLHERLAPVIEQPYSKFNNRISLQLTHMLSSLKSLCEKLMTKQNIPMMIMCIGSILIISIFRIAQYANRKEQFENNNSQEGLRPITSPAVNIDDTQGDYNIFATPEGVNIKLDLAQAYIHMRDLEGARDILQEIIINHHGKAVQEAKKLLKELHEPTKMLSEASS